MTGLLIIFTFLISEWTSTNIWKIQFHLPLMPACMTLFRSRQGSWNTLSTMCTIL